MVLESPGQGDEFTAVDDKVEISISWEDDGDSPTGDEITKYTFVLCTGPNDNIEARQTLEGILPSDITNNSYTASFLADRGQDGSYFVQVYSVLGNGGYMIRYTERFRLLDMTGTYEPSGSGLPPDGETDDSADAAANQGSISASFSIPYTEQTGKTRYAPMQLQPGSAITVSTWSRRFPSSDVTYYSTFLASPNVLSTVTAGWSYSVTSLINYATPAPFPSAVGWYAASEKLASASLDSSFTKRKLHKKRWID